MNVCQTFESRVGAKMSSAGLSVWTWEVVTPSLLFLLQQRRGCWRRHQCTHQTYRLVVFSSSYSEHWVVFTNKAPSLERFWVFSLNGSSGEVKRFLLWPHSSFVPKLQFSVIRWILSRLYFSKLHISLANQDTQVRCYHGNLSAND